MAALIDDRLLCIHGGIGTSINTIGDIENLDMMRPMDMQLDVKSI